MYLSLNPGDPVDFSQNYAYLHLIFGDSDYENFGDQLFYRLWLRVMKIAIVFMFPIIFFSIQSMVSGNSWSNYC